MVEGKKTKSQFLLSCRIIKYLKLLYYYRNSACDWFKFADPGTY